MSKLIAFRTLAALPQLALVSLLVFSITYLIPGSPAAALLGFSATPEAVHDLEVQLGLDRPAPERFGEWVGGLFRGDLGDSWASGSPVTQMIVERLPVTLALTGGGILVALSLGMSAGVLAALRSGSALDRLVTVGSSVGLAIPQFWLGLLLMLAFAVKLRWFPAIGYTPLRIDPVEWLRGLVLPSLALGVGAGALIARQTRNAMVAALDARYVDTLRAAGVRPRGIVLRYALKNALVPIVAVAGFQITTLLTTSVVVEHLFGLPGIASVLLPAVIEKDIPVVQGTVLVLASAVIAINLLADVLYGSLDPRARPQ